MSKNYFSNFDINKGSFGFSLFNTSFVNNTPTTITAGAGGLTLSVVGGGLRNKVSLELNKLSAINTQGQGLISDVLTLDRTDLARVLRFAFEFERTAGTIDASGTSTSSFEVWIYDVTNNSWIQPSGFRGITQITLPGTCSGEFQPPSTALALRLAIIYRQTDTNLWTMRFDEFELLQQSRARGAIITDWQEYTPSFQGFGTTTQRAFQWRRVGANCEIRGRFLCGTTTAVEAQITLPPGLTSSNALAPEILKCGDGAVNFVEAATFHVLIRPSATFLNFAKQSSGAVGYTIGIGSSWTSGSAFTFIASVPIAGWSSSVQVSSDTDTRIVAAKAVRSANQTITALANTVLTYTASSTDTHGALNLATGQYVVPVAGLYRVSARVQIDSNVTHTGAAVNLFVRRDGLDFDGNNISRNVQSGAIVRDIQGSPVFVECNAGQVLTLVVGNNENLALRNTASATFNHISIERISGPSQIAASEPVNASAVSTAGQVLAHNTDTILNVNIKDYDSHNSLTLGASARFTAPVNGVYEVQSMIRFANAQSFTASNLIAVLLYKNGSIYRQMANILIQVTNASTGFVSVTGSSEVQLNAGEYIEIRAFQNSGANRTLEANGATNWISIKKVN